MSKTSWLMVMVYIGVAGPLLPMPAWASSKAPLGYQLMCLKTPSECEGGGASVIAGSATEIATLQRVNASINRAIAPRADGAVDSWSAATRAGDCEDFVLAKRRALLKSGFPASALRIAYVKTRSGEGHAILVVKSAAGDFVLDNLDGTVRPLARSGYRLASMSGADPNDWS